MRRLDLAVACAVASAAAALPSQGNQRINYFKQVASYGVTGGIAEIVDASGDGNTLAFSDASAGRVGFVDITDPANPVALPDLVTGGEPTSVSFAGSYAVAAVLTTPWDEGELAPDPSDPANAGLLFVIDVSNPAAPVSLGTIPIGFQPDSVKLTTINGNLVAVVCIENEPIVVDQNELVLDEDIPGFPTSGATFPQDRSLPGLIQVITIDTTNVANSTVVDVTLPQATLAGAGLLYDVDPQPEFVDIHGATAAVSLQENNGMAIVDISDPAAPSLVRVFSMGNAAERLADLVEDEAISFSQGYPSSIGGAVAADTDGSGNPVVGGPRQPDSIAFTPDGSAIVSADEGELNFTGGRGWSIFSPDGSELYADAGQLEQTAVFFGQYPEGRSENRGMEIEGITTERFGNREFAFVMSERGSFMAVYDIRRINRPRFVQFLPTGISPEGITTIANRGLVITADEESGTLTIFKGQRRYPFDADQPLLYGVNTPFGAISGTDGNTFGVFGVPDNALPTSIFFVRLGGAFAPLWNFMPVTDPSGAQARYDGEGIVRDNSILAPWFFGGFFLASEGNGSSRPNLIVQTDLFGRVLREIQLPANIDAAADPTVGGNAVGSAGGGTIRGNGFEGVTLSADGRYLYACIQRQFNGEAATHTRIARYDLGQIANGTAPYNGIRVGGDWEFFYYPLEAATGAGFIGLSEIITTGTDEFLVVERDQGIGAETALKAVYAFSVAGLTPDADGLPGGNDTVSKVLAVDVQGGFFPFEKVEGLAIVRGDLWVSLDNDGGEVANRFVNTGRFVNPLN